MQRYEHSVLAACGAIHGEVCGTGSGNHYADELPALVRWLRWRVNEGWTPFTEKWRAYEWKVRELAFTVLLEFDEANRPVMEPCSVASTSGDKE
jgi:hypothetical protein